MTKHINIYKNLIKLSNCQLLNSTPILECNITILQDFLSNNNKKNIDLGISNNIKEKIRLININNNIENIKLVDINK